MSDINKSDCSLGVPGRTQKAYRETGAAIAASVQGQDKATRNQIDQARARAVHSLLDAAEAENPVLTSGAIEIAPSAHQIRANTRDKISEARIAAGEALLDAAMQEGR